MVGGWIIGVMLSGTRVSWIRGPCQYVMIGPSGMYGLGPMLGIAGQLPGKNVIYHAYIHPVFGCGSVVWL